LTKFFCFFLFTKRRFFLQLNLLSLLTIFSGRKVLHERYLYDDGIAEDGA